MSIAFIFASTKKQQCHHYSFNYVKGSLWKKTPCTSSLVPAYFWKVHIKCRETLPFQSVPLCMYLPIWRHANMGSISPPVTNRRQKEGNISNDVINVILRGGDFLVFEWTQRIRSVFATMLKLVERVKAAINLLKNGSCSSFFSTSGSHSWFVWFLRFFERKGGLVMEILNFH